MIEQIKELYYNKKLRLKKVGEILGVSETTVRKIMIKNNLKRRSNKELARKYYVNNNYFATIDTEDKAYWLGFMYADGHIRKLEYGYTITLTQVENGVLEKFKNCLESNYPISNYKLNGSFTKKDGTDTYYNKITINSEKLFNDLKNLGCIENKSLILKFPTEDQVPKHLIHHFIRGYFDGDGCVIISKSKRKHKTMVSTSYYSLVSICGTLEFLTGLKDNLPFLNNSTYKCIVKDNRKTTNSYALKLINNIRVKAFENFIYKDSINFLDRKRETFRDYNENYFKKVDRIVQSS